MKKKILSAGLIFTMVACLMVGCGDKKEEETTTSVETTGATTVATENVNGEVETTSSSIYINNGNGDNAGIDIFTDAAQVNKDADDEQATKNNDNKDSDEGEDLDDVTKQNNSDNNEQEETTKKSGSNNDDSEETTNDDSGWTPFY